MKRNEITLSSTHIDSHGDMMTKEALDSGAKIINGERRPRLGIEHDMTIPPIGRINDARVEQGKDGEYYLVAFQEYFDMHAETVLDDGTKLIKEYFSEGGKPFSEVSIESPEKIEIGVDKNNFESWEAMNAFYQELEEEIGIEFKKIGPVRKAVLNDPVLIIRLTEIFAIYFFGAKLFPKVVDKVADKAATDISKIYDVIKKTVKKIAKNSIPKNRPISYVFEFPGETHIDLIVKTTNPDVVTIAFNSEKLSQLKDKAEIMKNLFDAEKIQFYFNENSDWEFNYLLTKNGEVIGTPKSFERRSQALQILIEKSEARRNNENK